MKDTEQFTRKALSLAEEPADKAMTRICKEWNLPRLPSELRVFALGVAMCTVPLAMHDFTLIENVVYASVNEAIRTAVERQVSTD